MYVHKPNLLLEKNLASKKINVDCIKSDILIDCLPAKCVVCQLEWCLEVVSRPR